MVIFDKLRTWLVHPENHTPTKSEGVPTPKSSRDPEGSDPDKKETADKDPESFFNKKYLLELGLSPEQTRRFIETFYSFEWLNPEKIPAELSFYEGHQPTVEQIHKDEKTIRKELTNYRIAVMFQDVIKTVCKEAQIEEVSETIIREFALSTEISNTKLYYCFYFDEKHQGELTQFKMKALFKKLEFDISKLQDKKRISRDIEEALKKGTISIEEATRIAQEITLHDDILNSDSTYIATHENTVFNFDTYIRGKAHIIVDFFVNKQNGVVHNFFEQSQQNIQLWDNARDILRDPEEVFETLHGWTGDGSMGLGGVDHIQGRSESIDLPGHFLWMLDENKRRKAYAVSCSRLANKECLFAIFDKTIKLSFKEKLQRFRKLILTGFGPKEDAKFVAALHTLLGTYGSLKEPEKSRSVMAVAHSMGGAMEYFFLSLFGEQLDNSLAKDTEITIIPTNPALFDPNLSEADSNVWARPFSNDRINRFIASIFGSGIAGVLSAPLAKKDITGTLDKIIDFIAKNVLNQYLQNETRDDLAEQHKKNYIEKPFSAFISARGATFGQELAKCINWEIIAKLRKKRVKFLPIASIDDLMVDTPILLANHPTPEYWIKKGVTPLPLVVLTPEIYEQAYPDDSEKQKGSHYEFLRVLRQFDFGVMMRLAHNLSVEQFNVALAILYDFYQKNIYQVDDYVKQMISNDQLILSLTKSISSELSPEEVKKYLQWRTDKDESGAQRIQLQTIKGSRSQKSLAEVLYIQHPEEFAIHFILSNYSKPSSSDKIGDELAQETMHTLMAVRKSNLRKGNVGLDYTQFGGIQQRILDLFPPDVDLGEITDKLEALGKIELVLRSLDTIHSKYNWDQDTIIKQFAQKNGDQRTGKNKQPYLQPIDWSAVA